MSTTLQSEEGFILEDCRPGLARIRRFSARPLVALGCAVKPLGQGKSGIRGADLHALGGCYIEPSGGSHGYSAFMDSLVFPNRLNQPDLISGLEAVNPLDRLGTRPRKSKPVRAAHLPTPPALGLDRRHVGDSS